MKSKLVSDVVVVATATLSSILFEDTRYDVKGIKKDTLEYELTTAQMQKPTMMMSKTFTDKSGQVSPTFFPMSCAWSVQLFFIVKCTTPGCGATGTKA